MKKLLFTGYFCLLLGTSVIASPYDTITVNSYNLSSVIPNSYIRGVIAQGDVTRWNVNTFPLKVYIQQGSGVPEYYITQIKKAYAKWQNVTGGYISFSLVSSPDNADMKCYFEPDLPNLSGDTAGYHQFKYNGNLIADSVIRFRYADSKGRNFSPEMIYDVALHEIGHSLGLAGHSSKSSDLMYPVTVNRNYDISKRDLTTLKLLYSMVPDNTNKPLTESEKANLMTKAQVVGGEEQLLADAETAAKINTKITPDDPSSKIRLAIAYQKNGNYTKAINEYKSIIPLIDSSDIKTEIYAEITNCYISLKNYTAAQNCANYTYKKHPSQRSIVLYPQVLYAKGAKTNAVTKLIQIINNDTGNQYAIVLLKQIYNKEKNNYKLRKEILSALEEKGLL